MDLWARIKGKEYKLATGSSFSDELGETLDSGNIRIVHSHEVIDIKPYDDVIIHDDSFDYRKRSYGDGYTGNGFYRHMLCYSPQREQLSIDENDLSDIKEHPDGEMYRSWYFNYSISLVSETKGLEKIQLPNRTITQPMRTTAMESGNGTARTLYDVAKEMVDLYSPYIKYTDDGETWDPYRKYHFYGGDDTSHPGYKTIQLLKSKNCPEMSFQLPTLREVLNRIFNVVDAIPVVKDGIICHLSLKDRNSQFKVWKKKDNGLVSTGRWGRDVWQMDGGSYTDRIVREHSNSISKYSVTHMVEDVSFKNRDSGKLTLDSLRLELTYPIYDIRKVYMCYWKTKGGDDTQVYKVKQDITKLVLRNEKRQLLSEDWTKYSAQAVESEEEFAKFKYATIGFSQYSNYIGGWGERYTYLKKGFFTNFSYTNTVIENIFNFYNRINPYGEIDMKDITEDLDNGYYKVTFTAGNVWWPYEDADLPTYVDTNNNNAVTSIFSSTGSLSKYFSSDDGSWFTEFTLFLKTLFFEVEYDGIVSSSIMMSKSDHDGPIVTRDNPANSMAFVENDGINEHEKINRLGNASLVLEQVCVNTDELKEIADYRTDDPLVDNEKPLHEDEIIYRRSFTVFKDHIEAQYNLCKDYVLRNYFTSVYSKLRPFSYTSYNESVERKENKSVQIYLSQEHSYYQTPDSFRNVYVDDENDFISKMLSFYKPTKYNGTTGTVGNDVNNNCAYMYIPTAEPEAEGKYWGLFESDYLKYSSGNALCFNITMSDSVSAGVYMSRFAPAFGEYVSSTLFSTIDTEKNLDMLSGSLQEWYLFPTDEDTGRMETIQFGIGRNNRNDDMYSHKDVASRMTTLAPQMWTSTADLGDSYHDRDIGVRYYDGDEWKNTYNDKETNKYGTSLSTFMKAMFWKHAGSKYAVCKDGSERLNVTLETEFVTDDNIFASDRIAMLSDAYGSVQKMFDDTMKVTSYTRSYVAKNWCVWRNFTLNNIESNQKLNSWSELLVMFPSLTMILKNSDLKAMESKEYSDTEMYFSWNTPDSRRLNVHVVSMSWAPLEMYVIDNFDFSGFSNSGEMYSSVIEYYKTIYTDGMWPYPKVTLSISVDTDVNGDNPTTVTYNKIGVYLYPISSDDTKASMATNIYSVASDGKNLKFSSNMGDPFGIIMGLIRKEVTGKETSVTYHISESLNTTLCKSIVNYNIGGSQATSFAIAFPFFRYFKNMLKKNDTVSDYVTDYYFDKVGQPNTAFKALEGINLDKEGLILMNLSGWKVKTHTAGDETDYAYESDDSFSPSIMYSSEIISHLDSLSSSKTCMGRNMMWAYRKTPLAENDIYTDYSKDAFSSAYITETISDDQADAIASFSDGKAKFTFPFTVPVGGSVALFILEDSKYKFVFGMNNMTGTDTNTMTLYASLVEDRCKTVYDIHMDPICSITDYASSKFTYGKANYVVGGSGTGGSSVSGGKKTYKYVDGNGAVVQSGRCNEDGSVPDYIGDTPKKDDGGGYTYEFVEWGNEVDKNGNITRTAKFKRAKKKATGDTDYGDGDSDSNDRTYKFVNDGTVLQSGTYDEGATPTSALYTKDTPTKSGGYKFTGWATTINGNAYIFTAEYEETFMVIWLNDDKKTILSSEDNTVYKKGDTPTYKGSPNPPVSTKDSEFTFIGWNPVPAELAEIDSTHHNYIATYEYSSSNWTSLYDLWVKLGKPSTINMTSSGKENAINVFVKEDYGDTLNWNSDAKTDIYLNNDDDSSVSGYKFIDSISTGQMQYEGKGTVKFEKFGDTVEYQAFRNKVYQTAADNIIPSEWFAKKAAYVNEWNEGNNGVKYKYFEQYDSDSNACALYEYNGTGDLAKESSWTKLSYVDHPDDMTVVEESRTFSLDNDTIASAIFIRGFKVEM